MTFRTRLLAGFGVVVLVPLAVFGLGIRRQMSGRLAAERVGALADVVRADIARQSDGIATRLAALKGAMAADNRFRAAAMQGGDRTFVLDYAGDAMRLTGLDFLQILDDDGHVVSSGHFRNEYDRPAAIPPPDTPALLLANTAEGRFLAFVRRDALRLPGRRFTLLGGVRVDTLFLSRLARDRELAVGVVFPGEETTGRTDDPGQVVAEVALPYVALGDSGTYPARIVVTQSQDLLAAVRRNVNTWFAIAVLVSALVAVLIAGWLSTRFSRPMTEMERRVVMGDLARQVNHDIKNGLGPLRNVFRHFAQVAEKEPATLPKVFADRQGTVESSIGYLETLAANYARLYPQSNEEPTDLNAVVRAALRPPPGPENVDVLAELADRVPAVRADALALRRVIQNLLGNAVDSLEGKPGTVTIATESGPNGTVRLTVSDTGRGMSKAEVDRAFDDFYTTKKGGTGLGLSIVRRLILDAHGTLRVDSHPGKGSKFIVELPQRMTLVLIVDDVAAMAEQYAYDLKRLRGYETIVAGSGRAALDTLAAEPVDCVILDLEMPGMDGFEVLRSVERLGLRVPVIVYTGTGNYDRCAQAIRLGAVSFIDKAEPMERVGQEVENAIERRRLADQVAALRRGFGVDSPLVGASPALAKLQQTIARIAPIPSPVLILGESGTGKELVARELHRLGAAPKGPFIAVNSAALPHDLIESELFGHERGAFTGAAVTRKGAFEAASGGTLFLDEIGDLPLAAQAKLLRVLEERHVTRVGGTKTIAVDTRVVAATHRDLEQEVAEGRFREDLFFRLNVHPLRVPPLRDRLSDVPALVEHLLAATCSRFGMKPKVASAPVLDALMAYEWRRNNVRELRNVIERMVIATDRADLTADDVPPEIRDHKGRAAIPRGSSASPRRFEEQKLEAERQIIVSALERNDWHITHTAKELGLSDHASLLKIMRRLGVQRDT